jgi:translation elongation factor EF-1beta
MGKTLVIFKIKPKELEDIDKAIEEIKQIKTGIVKDIKRVPIGFGVEIIKAAVLFEEKKEDIEGATKEINSLPSVEAAEAEGMTLL